MKGIALLLACLLFFTSCQSTDQPTVTVTGESSVFVLPDMITVSIAAEYTGHTSAEARAVVSGMINKAVSVLSSSFNVDESDVTTAGFSLYPVYSYPDGVQTEEGQRAVERIDVILHDPEVVGDVIESLSALDGITISEIIPGCSDITAAEIKARSLAVEDAINKASVYATSAGYMLGNLISLSGVSLPDSPKLYAAKSSTGTEYHSGTISIDDSVTAVFSLLE
ncbi:MAG: SIMPL domain-containing protein [Spirochaetes bacterium]|uniref:SIMPL domain-containing protein n=1 Tax=Candidatus Ornithospirochaeta stercoripullorum TaxID=2840899 RepID=A0A9D9H608_9SPIO|nr:SIMPL domain-containing protein [Candidatus Ornithospirochaeta stercoripullorum]